MCYRLEDCKKSWSVFFFFFLPVIPWCGPTKDVKERKN